MIWFFLSTKTRLKDILPHLRKLQITTKLNISPDKRWSHTDWTRTDRRKAYRRKRQVPSGEHCIGSIQLVRHRLSVSSFEQKFVLNLKALPDFSHRPDWHASVAAKHLIAAEVSKRTFSRITTRRNCRAENAEGKLAQSGRLMMPLSLARSTLHRYSFTFICFSFPERS